MPAFNKIGDTFKSFSVIDRVVIVFLILWMLLVASMGELTYYNYYYSNSACSCCT